MESLTGSARWRDIVIPYFARTLAVRGTRADGELDAAIGALTLDQG